MTLISVITAVAVGTPADHLAAAYASLTDQGLPVGHQWEWVVQLDGNGALELPEPATRDDRVLAGRGPHGGPAMARNLALARSSGAIVVNLDADDQLTHGALGRIVDALIDPDTGWATSAVIDLHPDGSQRRFDADPPDGRLHRGTVTKHWTTHDWALLVHPSTLAARRELVIAIGGWLGAGLRGLVWERARALEDLIGPTQAHNSIGIEPPVVEQPSVPRLARGEWSWILRAVLAVGLVHLGALVGVAAANPTRWIEMLAVAAISALFYVAVGGLLGARYRRRLPAE